MQAQKSPYNELRKPMAGGLGFAGSARGGTIDELLSISIFYPNHSQPSAWDFLCGRVDNICVKIEVKPIPADFLHRNYQSDPEYKRSFQSWLSSHWDDMDNSMAELHQLSKDNSWSQ
jgi:hypothetical protein